MTANQIRQMEREESMQDKLDETKEEEMNKILNYPVLLMSILKGRYGKEWEFLLNDNLTLNAWLKRNDE